MSFKNLGKKIIHKECDSIERKFIASEAIAVGQEVYLSASNEVSLRAGNPAETPIGWAVKDAETGDTFTVDTNLRGIHKKIASANITAGDLLVENGTLDSEKRPEVAVAASGNLVLAVALEDAAVGELLDVGMLYMPVTAP